MQSINSLPSVAISPTKIDDDGTRLLKSSQTSYSDTAIAINKLIATAKALDTSVEALKVKAIPLNDLDDVVIATPAAKQLLEYEESTATWKNKTKAPATVSFCFIYPLADQSTPYYKFTSDKTITGIDILAGTAPSSAITVRVYKSDGTQVTSQSFSGQNSHYSCDFHVATGELYYAKIVGAANGANLVTVELTVIER